MPENKTHIGGKKKRKKFGFFLKVFFYIFLFLVVVQTTLVYFANPILKTALKVKIKEATQGVFDVDFDRVSVNLQKKSFVLTDFRLIPNQEVYDSLKNIGQANKALYAITFSRLEFNQVSIYKFIKSGNLTIQSIMIEKPLIRLLDVPDKNTKKKKYDAVHKDLYPIISNFLNSLAVHRVLIKDGYFDFAISKNDKQIASTANKVSLLLVGFYLDGEAYKQRAKLFYSDKIVLKISDYVLGLNDSIHVLRAKNVSLSTTTSEIKIKKISILPEQIKRRDIQSIKKNYIKAHIPEITIGGVDPYDIFFNKIVNLEKMALVEPDIKLYNNSRKTNTKNIETEKKELDLYAIINEKFTSLNVDVFVLEKAKLAIYKKNFGSKPATSIGSLSILLENFKVDSLSNSRNDKLLYADNISLNMFDYKMKLADMLHQFKADELIISTSLSQILASGVNLSPIRKGKKSFKIAVPRLQLDGIDLKKVYNSKQLPVNNLLLENPTVDIYREKTDGKKQKKAKKSGQFSRILKDYLTLLTVKNTALVNGKFNIEEYHKQKGTNYSSGILNLKVDSFTLDPHTQNLERKLFDANNIRLTVSDYKMRPANNLHVLSFDSLIVATNISEIKLKGLRLTPSDNVTITKQLMEKEKSSTMAVSVRDITIANADFRELYLGSNLKIDEIRIHEPLIDIVGYPYIKKEINEQKRLEEELLIAAQLSNEVDTIGTDIMNLTSLSPIDSIGERTKKDFYSILQQFVDTIHINQVNVVEGKFNYKIKDSDRKVKTDFSNDFKVNLENFFIDTAIPKEDNRLFFSDNIDVLISNYSVKITDNPYVINVDSIYLSTYISNVKLSNVAIVPNIDVANRKEMQQLLHLNIPEINFVNIDIKKLYKNKEFDLSDIEFVRPSIKLTNRPHFKKTKKTEGKKFVGLPKGIKKIKIDNIHFDNGNIEVIKSLKKKSATIINTNFSLNVNNLELDSTGSTFSKGEIPFADALSFSLDNYVFKLADSIHTLKAKELLISTKESRIAATGLTLKYDTLKNVEEMLKTNKKSNLMDFEVENFEMANLDFRLLFADSAVNINDMFFSNANLRIKSFVALRQDSLNNKIYQKPKNGLFATQMNFYPLIEKKLKQVSINNIHLADININFEKIYDDDYSKTTILKNISGQIDHLHIDSTSYREEGKFYNADNIQLKMNNYSKNMPDSAYRVTFKEAGFSMSDSLLYVNKLQFAPRYDWKKTSNVFGYQKSLNNIQGENVYLKGVDCMKFIESKKINATQMLMDSVFFQFYINKELPPAPIVRKPMLHTMFSNIKPYFKIDTFKLQNSYLLYEEDLEDWDENAEIAIDDINITIPNLTNDSVVRAKYPYLDAALNCDFMGLSHINANLRLALNSQDSLFNVNGTIGPMDVAALNPFLEKSVLVKVESGKLLFTTFDFYANDSVAEGEMRFLYEDLKVALVNKKGKTRGGKAVGSFIANMLLKNSNPDKDSVVIIGNIYNQRNRNRSTANQIIKALLSGVKSTLGFEPSEVKRKRKEEQQIAKLNDKIIKKRKKNRSKWIATKHDEYDIRIEIERKLNRQTKRNIRHKNRVEKRKERQTNRKIKELIDLRP